MNKLLTTFNIIGVATATFIILKGIEYIIRCVVRKISKHKIRVGDTLYIALQNIDRHKINMIRLYINGEYYTDVLTKNIENSCVINGFLSYKIVDYIVYPDIKTIHIHINI